MTAVDSELMVVQPPRRIARDAQVIEYGVGVDNFGGMKKMGDLKYGQAPLSPREKQSKGFAGMLTAALDAGDAEQIEWVLSSKWLGLATAEDLKDALESCARAGDEKSMERVLALDLDWRAAFARSAVVHYAIESRSFRCVELLAKAGLDMDVACVPKDGFFVFDRTPLWLAASYGEVEMAAFLLEMKPDVSAQGAGNVLYEAVDSGSVEIVDMLLKAGADPNGVGVSRDCILMGAILNFDEEERRESSVEIAKLLLNAGADANPFRRDPFHRGYSALNLAVFLGSQEIAKELLARGADVSAEDEHFKNSVEAAVNGQDESTTLMLLGRLLEMGQAALDVSDGKWLEYASIARKKGWTTASAAIDAFREARDLTRQDGGRSLGPRARRRAI